MKPKECLMIAVIAAVCIYLIYSDEIETFVSSSHVCNDVDGRCYKVVGKFHSSEKASEVLAYLNRFSIKVIKHLRRKYLWEYNSNQEARELVQFLLSNYNPDGIIENAPVNDVNTSFVDEKGKIFGICLREKISGNNDFHDMHDLEFVVLHELSHMANVTYGHDQDFWEVFKFILQEAKEANLHEPINYKNNPMNYCSLIVDHNPYFDRSIRSIKM